MGTMCYSQQHFRGAVSGEWTAGYSHWPLIIGLLNMDDWRIIKKKFSDNRLYLRYLLLSNRLIYGYLRNTERPSDSKPVSPKVQTKE